MDQGKRLSGLDSLRVRKGIDLPTDKIMERFVKKKLRF